MVAPLVALHALTQGTGPTIHVAAETSDDSLTALHDNCVSDGRCLVVGLGIDTEVVLAAVQTQKVSSPNPLFWGYCILRGVVSCGSMLFENGGQLPAVFDLDETLVMANSSHNLSQRLDSAARHMQAIKTQLECCSGAEEREKLQEQISAVEHEQNLLEEDLLMVQSYAESDCVAVNGNIYNAREEPVESENGATSRPVIRIPEDGVVLTRIDTSKTETSMVIRIRPGWDALRAYLTGQMENKRQKWKVLVCTAAEREYALEVWRLLDTAGDLIPPAERPLRIFSGARRKSLMHTLKLGPFCCEPLAAHCASGTHVAPLVEGVSEMPMALIIDDRLDVWDRRNRSQIVQVAPYLHYKNHRSPSMIPKYDENELMRVKSIFQNLRAELYFSLCEKTTKALAAIISQGIPAESKVMKMLSEMPTLAAVLDQVVSKPWPLPEERRNENRKDENSQNNGISLKPQDPRVQSPYEGNNMPRQGLLLPQDPQGKSHTSSAPDDQTLVQKQVDALDLMHPKALPAIVDDGLLPDPVLQQSQTHGLLVEGGHSSIPGQVSRLGQAAERLQMLPPGTMPLNRTSQNAEAGLFSTDPHHALMGHVRTTPPEPLNQRQQLQHHHQDSSRLLNHIDHQIQGQSVPGQHQALVPSGNLATTPPPVCQSPATLETKGTLHSQALFAGLQPARSPVLGLKNSWSQSKPVSLVAETAMMTWDSSEQGLKLQQPLKLALPTLANLSANLPATSNPEAGFACNRHQASHRQDATQDIGQMMQLQASNSGSGPEEACSSLQALQAAAGRGLPAQTQPLEELVPLQSEALTTPMCQSGTNFPLSNVGGIQRGIARQQLGSSAGHVADGVLSQGSLQLSEVPSSIMTQGPDRLPAPSTSLKKLQTREARHPLANVTPAICLNKPQPLGAMECRPQPHLGHGIVTQPEGLHQVSVLERPQQIQDPRARQAFFGKDVRPVLVAEEQLHLRSHLSHLPKSASGGTMPQPEPGPQQMQLQARPCMQGGIVGLPHQGRCCDLSPLGAVPLQVLTPQGRVSIAPPGHGLASEGTCIALQTPHGVVLLQSQPSTLQVPPGSAQKELAGTTGLLNRSQAADPQLPTTSCMLQPKQRPAAGSRGLLQTAKKKICTERGYIQRASTKAGRAGRRGRKVASQGRNLGNKGSMRQLDLNEEKLPGELLWGLVSSPESWKQKGAKRTSSQAGLLTLRKGKDRSLEPYVGEVLGAQEGSTGPYEQLLYDATCKAPYIDLGPQSGDHNRGSGVQATQELSSSVNAVSEGLGPPLDAAKQAVTDSLMIHQQSTSINSQQQQQQQCVDVIATDGRRDNDRRAPHMDTSLKKIVKRPRRGRRRDLDAGGNWGTRGYDRRADLTGYAAQLADGLDYAEGGTPRAHENDEEEEGEII